MPWWAWLLLDLFVVLSALLVVAAAGWSFWGRTKRFLRMLGEVRDQLPQVERPR